MPGPSTTPGTRADTGASTAPAFVAKVAQLTGLDQKVVAAWVKAEGAYAPNGTGGYNFLNIRTSRSYSGVPLAGTTSKGFAQFYNASDAATETAHWINSMPNYLGIRQAAKLGPRSQLAAIAASPWDSGHYGSGKNLYNDYTALSGSGGGIDWGGILSGGVGALNNPIGFAGGLGSHLPGVGGAIKSGTTVLDAPGKIAEEVGAVVNFAFNPGNWLRIGYIIGGGVFVIGGLFILAKSVGVANAVGGSTGPAAGAASVAAPELAAAKLATQQERTKEVRARRRHHTERARETRGQREERERKAYFRGAADAGR